MWRGIAEFTERQRNALHEGIFGLGETFYVSNSGLAPSPRGRWFQTIKQALVHCQAYRGDVIVVLPGHVEPVPSAAYLNINKAGVTILGAVPPTANQRAKIQLKTATSATVKVSAKNVTIANINFENNIAACALMLDVANDGLNLRNCTFTNAKFSLEHLIAIQSTAWTRTNLASLNGDEATGATVTSATGAFTQDMVGRSLTVTAGTSWTTGRYTIVSVNSTTSITVDRAVGSAAELTSGTGYISMSNDAVIENCTFLNRKSASPGATECIEFAGPVERWTIKNCTMEGAFSVAAISGITALSYMLQILDNRINNFQTGNVFGCVDLLANTTGVVAGNFCFNGYTSAIQTIDAGAADLGLNYGKNEITKYPILQGTADT